MLSEKQRELDTVEKQILVSLFGSEKIPDATGFLFSVFGINPNNLIKEFESFMIPIMNEDGSIDGSLIKKMLSVYPKFRKVLSFIEIPEGEFFLSDKIFQFINVFLPGVDNA